MGAAPVRDQVPVRGVAEALVLLGPPHRHQDGGARGRGRGPLRRRVLAQVGELAHPGDGPLARGHLTEVAVAHVGDAGCQRAVDQHGRHAAGGLQLLEQRPGGGGQFVGEGLDVPGAAGGVQHPSQVRLLQQQQLGVAGHAAAQFRRVTPQGVVGLGRDAVGTGHPGGEGGRGDPQQVHPRVPLGEHPAGRADVHLHRPRGLGGAAGPGHGRPHPAGGAELGDGREHLRIGAEGHLHLPAGRVRGQPGRGHGPEVGGAGAEQHGQFLRLGRTGLHRGQRADGDGPHAGVPRRGPGGQGAQIPQEVRHLPAPGAVGGHDPQRVGPEATHRSGRVHAPGRPQGLQGVGGVGRIEPRFQHHGSQVQVHALQAPVQVRGRGRPPRHPEAGHPPFQVRQGPAVGLGRVGMVHDGPHVPQPVGPGGGMGAAGERCGPREAGLVQGAGGGVPGVQRRHRDAVVGPGDEAVEGTTLEDLVHQGQPGVLVGGREAGRQRHVGRVLSVRPVDRWGPCGHAYLHAEWRPQGAARRCPEVTGPLLPASQPPGPGPTRSDRSP